MTFGWMITHWSALRPAVMCVPGAAVQKSAIIVAASSSCAQVRPGNSAEQETAPELVRAVQVSPAS
jgi:hypothetical protein